MFRLASAVRLCNVSLQAGRVTGLKAAAPVVVPVRTWFGFGVKYNPKEEEVEPLSYLKPLVDDESAFVARVSDQERKDREALTNKIRQLADENPESVPDAAIVSELVELLVKYDDRRAVLGVTEFADEIGVKFDHQLQSKINHYLHDANIRCLHEKETF